MKIGIVFPQTEIGVDCILPPSQDAAAARDKLKSLEDLGVTHVSVVMMNLGLASPEAHFDALKGYWDVVGDLCSG